MKGSALLDAVHSLHVKADLARRRDDAEVARAIVGDSSRRMILKPVFENSTGCCGIYHSSWPLRPPPWFPVVFWSIQVLLYGCIYSSFGTAIDQNGIKRKIQTFKKKQPKNTKHQ